MDRGVHEGAQMHSEHVSDVSDGGKQSEGYISLLVHYHVTASQNALAWASNGARGGEAEDFTSFCSCSHGTTVPGGCLCN